MREEDIRKSFENVKMDINEIINEVKNISDAVFSLKPKKTLVSGNGKIYTSKVFVDDEIRNSVSEVFDSGIFTSGEKLKEFEEKFAEYCGIKHALAVSNGTVAIELVLRGLGIGKDDEIIVPSHTTMPTVEPILTIGAKPVFVDILEDTYNINPSEVERAITKKTKAVLVVNIYGNAAELEELKQICDKHKIHLIEDCAQAHGTRYNNRLVGTFGIAGCFSFYPTKNMTVCGEGGMIITDNGDLANIIKKMRSHGEDGRYNHVVLGGNYRLSEIHCAIGIKQLERLEYFIERRREIAKIYDKMFENNPNIIRPVEAKNAKHSYHLYVIRVSKKIRDDVIKELAKKDIFLGIHYPIPAHRQEVIKNMMKVPELKITEKISKEIISLPIYPLLSDDEAKMIAENINRITNS